MTNPVRSSSLVMPWPALIGAALSGLAVSAALYPVAQYYASGPCVSGPGDSACSNSIIAYLVWSAACLAILPIVGWLVLRLRRVDRAGTVAMTALSFTALGVTAFAAFGWLNSAALFIAIAGLVVVGSYPLAYRLWASTRLSHTVKFVLSIMPIVLIICLSFAPFILLPLLRPN